jgi:septum formation inhibitor-activating ATPase MinD
MISLLKIIKELWILLKSKQNKQNRHITIEGLEKVLKKIKKQNGFNR